MNGASPRFWCRAFKICTAEEAVLEASSGSYTAVSYTHLVPKTVYAYILTHGIEKRIQQLQYIYTPSLE